MQFRKRNRQQTSRRFPEVFCFGQQRGQSVSREHFRLSPLLQEIRNQENLLLSGRFPHAKQLAIMENRRAGCICKSQKIFGGGGQGIVETRGGRHSAQQPALNRFERQQMLSLRASFKRSKLK